MSVFLSSNQAVIELKSESGPAKRVAATLFGARPKASAEPLDPLNGRVNYLLGADPRKWVTDVPTFGRVKYRGVYEGIDVVYYGNGANLEHDFVVAPGADPYKIRFALQGAETVATNADGHLSLKLGGSELLWKKPVVYQVEDCGARKPVEARYRALADGEIGFEVGAYDPKRELVIDPEIQFATYLGRNGTDIATRTTTDASGNIYVTGGTMDAQFPVTPGAFTTAPGASDRNNVMISKLRADGSALVYSTYVGGQSSDAGLGIAVDRTGNVYVAGVTLSNDFPTTEGAFRRNPGDSNAEESDRADCFVLKLNSAGNGLVYSTFLGGRRPDGCTGIAVDSAGTAYVTGATSSTDFPTTPDVFQRQLRLGLTAFSFDGFLTRINSTGSALIYSTFFGGNGIDIPSSIVLDSLGNAYLAGATNSNSGFPVSRDALQRTYSQSGPLYRPDLNDGFVLKFDPAGTNLLYGTYLGGAANDAAFGISIDRGGNAYVCGNTESTDFPATAQAMQPRFQGGGSLVTPRLSAAGDAFVAKLNPEGSALVFSTFLGGRGEDRAFGCAVDEAGNVHVTGNTTSADFPVTADAQQRTYGGRSSREFIAGDAFYTKLNNTGAALVYSTYYGGNGDDAGLGLYLDSSGMAYVSGGTTSSNLPASQSAVQRGYGGGPQADSAMPFGDAFVVKLGETPKPVLSVASAVNSASYGGAAVAPGEWVLIDGVGIGPETAVSAPQDAPPSTKLASTRVLFDEIEAPLLSVSATQILAIVPFGVGVRDPAATQLVIEYQGNQSAPTSLALAPSAPGLFTSNSIGRGQASATNEDGSANSIENPAAPGSIFTLFGTGAGVTDPPSTDGAIESVDFPPLAGSVSIQIGDVAVEEIFFAGGVKGKIAGIFQVQFRLPAGLPDGELPVSVSVGGVVTQPGVTVSIATPPEPSDSLVR